MPLLEAQDVTVRFGGTAALDRTSIGVERGVITGLIGPNGAGKTTLFNVVCGLLAPQAGRVVLDGTDITSAPPHRRARLGLARTFQRLELFTSLTVRDNVRVGGDIRNRWTRGRADSGSDAERIIEMTRLGAIADREVSEIPTGRARVVELARALMTRPSVLLLDEPAAGQTERETEEFGGLLRRLAADGLAVCLVEHDMTLVMDVCQTINVLDYGRTIASGPPDQVRNDPAVIEAYLGTPEGVG
ncbi:MAG TPA: ABC transporter ATP-binding protein [Acidimicrobiales bacterium]|nr:ABC transporter ATP-binding protein [Acidimicrobiales bacterium]